MVKALTQFCLEELPRQSLRGMFQTVWQPTMPEYRHRHYEAIETVERAVAMAENVYRG